MAGQVVVFPAWLRHWVPAHCGDGSRVSVAFNAAVFVDGRELPEGGLAPLRRPAAADASQGQRTGERPEREEVMVN